MEQIQIETAKAFSLKLKEYDKDSQWDYTFQARSKLERMERSIGRLYEAQCLSLKDFKRFDDMIFNRMIKIES
mgnify:CR=1 FL=1|jgi:hypothetical protein|tara:strand:- start:938 stop:1156 length:219 start_codon:yes stop_codon:yes gene_type:complete